MDRINLHLFLSSIQNETRLIKEAKATLSLGVFSRVFVLGLWDSDLPLVETHSSGLEIHRVKTLLQILRFRFPSMKRGFVTKIFSLFGILQYAITTLWLVVKLRPSHVSCHNLLLLPVAWVAAKLAGSDLVYLPHELEVERTGLTGWMKRLSAIIESSFIHSCSVIVVVCEPIANWYRSQYKLQKVFVVRAIPEFPLSSEALAQRDKIRAKHNVPDDAILFIYQGVLAATRGVDDLVRVFKKIDDRFHLMLMGYGEAVDRIVAAAKECKRIHFQPAVPVEQIIQYSCAADVGIFVIHDPLTLSYQLSLPNKFFEYLYAGLPVIVSDNLSLLTQIVHEHHIGWSIKSHDLSLLIEGLEHKKIEAFRSSVLAYTSNNTWDSERLLYKIVYKE